MSKSSAEEITNYPILGGVYMSEHNMQDLFPAQIWRVDGTAQVDAAHMSPAELRAMYQSCMYSKYYSRTDGAELSPPYVHPPTDIEYMDEE